MKVFTCTGFQGHWPVGTSAVVVAANKEDAWIKLNAALVEAGLDGLFEGDDELAELDTKTPRAIILQDGEY